MADNLGTDKSDVQPEQFGAKVENEVETIKKFGEFCTRVKVIGAEVASTVIFLVVLYVAVSYEIHSLLK